MQLLADLEKFTKDSDAKRADDVGTIRRELEVVVQKVRNIESGVTLPPPEALTMHLHRITRGVRGECVADMAEA